MTSASSLSPVVAAAPWQRDPAAAGAAKPKPERDHDDSSQLSPAAVSKFQGVLLPARLRVLAFGVSWPGKLPALCGMDAVSPVAPMRVSKALFWEL